MAHGRNCYIHTTLVQLSTTRSPSSLHHPFLSPLFEVDWDIDFQMPTLGTDAKEAEAMNNPTKGPVEICREVGVLFLLRPDREANSFLLNLCLVS